MGISGSLIFQRCVVVIYAKVRCFTIPIQMMSTFPAPLDLMFGAAFGTQNQPFEFTITGIWKFILLNS